MLSLGVFACLAMLAYASYSDWKKREISDPIWIIFSVVGLVLIFIELIGNFSLDLLFLIVTSIGVTSFISFLIYYFGFFGGADMKALIVIAILIPVFYAPNHIHPVIALTSLTNGCFLVLGLPLSLFILNLSRKLRGEKIFKDFEDERLWKKILVSFLGYRVKRAEEGHFLMSLEKTIEGKKSFNISLLTDEEFVSGEDIWATPGIPLIIFITLGFIFTLIYGDFLTLLFRF